MGEYVVTCRHCGTKCSSSASIAMALKALGKHASEEHTAGVDRV